MYRRESLSVLGYGPRRLFTDTVKAMRLNQERYPNLPAQEEEEGDGEDR